MAKTIVLIDDDSDDLDIMKEVIQQIDGNVECMSFSYPDEAIRLLTIENKILPDYIFIDINMPRLSGEECLQKLRETSRFLKTPIILYSTTMPATTSERLLTNGATFTFEKPYRLEKYRSILEQIVIDKIAGPRHLSGL
jgi:CheY-like chemotaxis protein